MPDPRPYIIRRDGTVVDRQSGEVVGDTRPVVTLCWRRGVSSSRVTEWEFARIANKRRGKSRYALTRHEAADALWAEHERRREAANA